MSILTITPVDEKVSLAPGETILDGALRTGFLLKHGCRDGRCGDCRAPVVKDGLAAEVRYPDGIELNESDRLGETVLCCQAVPLSDITIHAPEITEHKGISIQSLVSRVKEIKHLSDDVVQLKLMLAPGSEFNYLPGQYVDLTLPNSVTRSYSMATSAVEDGCIELHIRLKEGGEATSFIFSELEPKTRVQISGPYGSFYLRNDHTPIIFLASGTGFAPIKGLMQQLVQSANKRPVFLYWGGRTPEDLYMNDLCQEWQSVLSWFTYIPVISDGSSDWNGRTGFVHHAVLDDYEELSAMSVYACGAPIVVESAKKDFINNKGLLAENFFSDSFI
jgi:CDP-4-dehydro-6-deoxyglucose reductase